jgi:hypothetical protein
MSCCQSQNREHKCDGAGGYGEDHNAVVRKKHGVHHAPPYLCLERRDRSLNALAVICDLGSGCAFSYMGKIREPVMCSSWQTWNQKNCGEPGTTLAGLAFANPELWEEGPCGPV